MSAADEQPARLLVGACGAAAVLLLPSYLTLLRARLTLSTTVLLTASAASFVAPRAIGLLCDRLIDSSDPETAFTNNHVRLGLDHDLILVLPCSANLLADLAHGLAPSLLTATLLAADCPVLLAPGMNRRMWTRPAVQRNVAQVRQDGYGVIDPVWRDGLELATNSAAENPVLPSPAEIVEQVRTMLGPPAESARSA